MVNYDVEFWENYLTQLKLFLKNESVGMTRRKFTFKEYFGIYFEIQDVENHLKLLKVKI